MKKEELEAIKRRCEAASPAPWTLGDPYDTSQGANLVRTGSGSMDFFQCRTVEDNRFCAAAREDVPALVAEVERLRGLLTKAVDHLSIFHPYSALVVEVEQLRGLLTKAADRLDSFDDDGPPGMEYKSGELEKLIAEIRDALGDE